MRGLVVAAVLAGCAPKLRAAEVAAVRATVEAGTDVSTAAYMRLVGAARIVGVGTWHAGADGGGWPGLRQADLEAMVLQHGFAGLALDGDATATRALDAFVGGAAVDLDGALQALGDPRFVNSDLRHALAWLRRYNLREATPPEGPGPTSIALTPGQPAPTPAPGVPRRRVRVFGLDPRDGDAAAAVVLAYLERVDPAYVPTARSLLQGGEQLGVDAVLRRLDERREAYAVADPAAWVDARQQAEVAAQARRMAETWEFEAREFARARNAEWALAQLDGGRLIVLAGNRQIAAEVPGAAPSMGNFLRQWFAEDYRAIGTSFGGGQVRGDGCAVTAVAAEAGSFDAVVAASGAPFALIDLRGRGGALARTQRIGGETLRPAAAFDAIWAFARARPAWPMDDRCMAGIRLAAPP